MILENHHHEVLTWLVKRGYGRELESSMQNARACCLNYGDYVISVLRVCWVSTMCGDVTFQLTFKSVWELSFYLV